MKIKARRDLQSSSVSEKVSQFYDAGSPDYLEVFGEHIHDGYYITGRESRKEAQDNLIKLFVEKAQIQKGSRILDIGCGVGGSSVWLAKNMEAITIGITISPVQVELAQRLAQKQKANSSFLLMNAEGMSFPDTFDVIWVVACISHFQKQNAFLQRAINFLKKDGQLVLFDWMVDEAIADADRDPLISQVKKGMLMDHIYSMKTYQKWLEEDGYRLTYSEDITERTLHTWDIDISTLLKPAVWKKFLKMMTGNGGEILTFLKARNAIKRAMHQGKVRAAFIIAEKIG